MEEVRIKYVSFKFIEKKLNRNWKFTWFCVSNREVFIFCIQKNFTWILCKKVRLKNINKMYGKKDGNLKKRKKITMAMESKALQTIVAILLIHWNFYHVILPSFANWINNRKKSKICNQIYQIVRLKLLLEA